MIPLFDYNKYNLIMETPFQFGGLDFLHFDEAVSFYSLFRSKRLINSFWEIKYIAEVLLHLNPDIDPELFKKLIIELSDRDNGHTVRTYSKYRIGNMCDELLEDKPIPYVRRPRKIVFNPSKMIPLEEKRVIIGRLSGKNRIRITEDRIYQAYEKLAEKNLKITYSKLAHVLKCTRQTVSKNITISIKELIKYHNRSLHSS